jgi:hypothetical protein
MKIAVIQARLPYIDRRALSEAWFSALHLAAGGRRAAAPQRMLRAQSLPATERTQRQASGPSRGTSLVVAAARSRPASEAASALVPAPRRAEPGIRALPPAGQGARSYPPFRTSLTFGIDGRRVQLLLRRDGATLYVVALCRPEIAEAVRRALQLAGEHLGARGESMHAAVHIVPADGRARGRAL